MLEFVTFWIRRTKTAARKRNVTLSSSTNESSSVISLENVIQSLQIEQHHILHPNINVKAAMMALRAIQNILIKFFT